MLSLTAHAQPRAAVVKEGKRKQRIGLTQSHTWDKLCMNGEGMQVTCITEMIKDVCTY